MGQANFREKIYWWFVYSVVKHKEGETLNLPLKILHFLFFPLMTIHYQIGKHNGYQWETGIWIIHGMKYSDAIFKHFAFGDGCWYRVIKRADGLVTIEEQAPK